MKKGIRKALSVLLSMALTVTGMGVTVYAEEPLQGTGLCEHHRVHDSSCGYVAPVEGHVCEHKHTDDCYIEVDAATPSQATPGNGAKQKVLNCPHERGEHDGTCGYVEAVEGKPCMYQCAECGSIPYMDADGTPHYDLVGQEHIKTVSAKEYKWTNSTDADMWYYLKDSQTFNDRIEVMEGDVKLVLGRGATLTANRGICVVEGASLTIYGQDKTGGTLKAYSRSSAYAAIGGGASGGVTGTSGDITINSGSVYAGPASGLSSETIYGSAGIGTGSGGLGSVITINGGSVTAEGIGDGPGIGAGSNGSHIIINGGTVNATGGSAVTGYKVEGAEITGGAGIGGGASSPIGTIEIKGGTVTATGGTGASGIGTGSRGGAGSSITISGGAKVTARGDRAAIDADLSFDGVYDGDYVVIGNEQKTEGGVVTEFRVNGDTKQLKVPTTVYRYLKAEPRTLKAVAVSPRSVLADIGQKVSFSVMTADGVYPEADATEILKTSWSLSSGIAGYQPVKNTALTGGILSIGGDEKLEKLIVSAECVLPEGVKMAQNTANVTVHQTKYTVSFDANGGWTNAAPMLTTMGRLTDALPVPSRTGYTFIGWYQNRPAEGTEPDTSTQINGNTVYTQDTTLYAGWRVNQYTVTYYSMGGNPASFARTVAYGGHAPKPAVPVKDLAVFEGWYTDPGYTRQWNFDRDTVTGDMELYAKWSAEVLDVTVSAEAVPANGGSVRYAGKYRSGSLVTLEAVPAAGYEFLRWTKDGEAVSNSARYQFTVDEDTELKAVFGLISAPESDPGSISGSEKDESAGSKEDENSSSSGSVPAGSVGDSGSAGSPAEDHSGDSSGSSTDDYSGGSSGSSSDDYSGGSSGSSSDSHSGGSSESSSDDHGGSSGSSSDDYSGGSSGSSSGSHSGGSSGGSSGGYSGGGSGSSSGSHSGGSSGGSSGGGGSRGAGGTSAGTVQSGPAAPAPAPTVVPGSGSAISTVVTVADAAAANVANAQSVAGAWVQNEQGWTLQVGGTAAVNSWVCVAEKDGAHWYHFSSTGLMDTGWLTLDGKRYYLHADHDGTAGRMMTGWQLLDGKWYYFSSASDATLGMLLTDTVTPDGYRVNAQGEWIQ